MKNDVFENFAKFTGKHLWFAKFLKIPFLENTSGRLLLAFRATLLKRGTANRVWKTWDEDSLSRNTNLRSTVQVYHFFFRQDKLSVYVFIGLHCLLPEAAIRVEVFCKKGVLKDFVNFIGKHLCWSLFLIKLQAWHLFWRTSANDCFCTALAPLIVTYPFYFIFSTFFLIITATTVNISDVCFWFKFKRLQRI